MGNFVTGALVHLQIGRAYAMADDSTKAKAAYQDLVCRSKHFLSPPAVF
jgi:hypothetical protein